MCIIYTISLIVAPTGNDLPHRWRSFVLSLHAFIPQEVIVTLKRAVLNFKENMATIDVGPLY